jgi:hypothetical protein
MKNKKIFAIALICLAPTYIFATSSLSVTTGLGSSADTALQDEINKQFQVPNMTDFLKSMSNAQSIANKGQGVSYATDHSLFVLGVNAGAGLNTTSGFTFNSTGGLPAIGLGAQGSIVLGVSLSKLPVPAFGPIDLKRLKVFANFFTYTNDSLVDSLTIKMNTFGLHLQYLVIDGKNIGGLGLLNWGGVAFTTGFDTSSNTMTYKVGQKITATSSGTTFTWTPNSSSALMLDANSFTIPLEVSTSIRLAYILSLFGGVGVDLNFGKSTVSANMTGPITNSTNATTGSATLAIAEEKGPTFGDVRFFLGPQINLVPLKNTNLLSLYAQGNISTGGNYGAHLGLRIAW